MMHQRGGFPTKALIYAVFVVLMVYMVYIYHGSQSQLRESEMSGSRFKREAEERVTEINELVKAKDRAEETCRSEKSELNTRIKSINQQHSLLQSQYKETEADFIKLQKDIETIKSEHAQAESAHAQEFERLKQEKELDIAQLKDEIADLKRKNTALESSISSLREKIKNDEDYLQGTRDQYKNLEQNFYALQNAQKALMDENGRLQQQLQTKQQLPGKDSQGVPQQQFQNQDVHKQPLQNNFQNLQFGGNNQQDVARIPGTGLVKNMQINEGKFNEGKFNNLQTLGQGAGQLGGQNADQNKADGFVQLDSLKNEIDQARPQVQDFNNDARQVQPPLNNDEFNNDDNKDDDDENKETDLKDEDMGLNNKIEFRPQVNPNDEQSNQILGPNLDNFDKQQGGGEAGVERMNVRGAEEARENGVKEEAEEDGLLQHKNPLALGQIEVPGAGDGQRGWENPEEGRAGQQMPPLLKEEDEQDNGDNQYLGEEEEEQQLGEEEEEEGDLQEEEEEEDERNFDERFQDDTGNLRNGDEAADNLEDRM